MKQLCFPFFQSLRNKEDMMRADQMTEIAAAAAAAEPTDRQPVGNEPPRPVPSLGVLETRPLTDREREAAYGMILWWAMHGGC